MTPDGDPAGLTAEVLAPVVARVLNVARPHVTTWSTDALHGGLDKASGVWRIRGSTRVDDAARSWSLVLKVCRPVPGGADPAGAFYWRRDVCAYESGLLADLAPGLVAPRCFGIDDRNDTVWLWLEEVTGLAGEQWSFDQAVTATRCLGAFSSPYLAGRPLPEASWLLPSWRRVRAAAAAPGMVRLAAMRGHPLVQAGWPNGLDEVVLRFWEDDQPTFLDALDRLPRALQHGDPNALNLFLRPTSGGDEVVALDWGSISATTIGEDLATLVNWFGDRGPSGDWASTTDHLVDAYVAGLHDAGWEGEASQVRLGYLLTTALTYLAHPMIVALLDPAEHARVEQARGMPIEAFLGVLAGVMARGVTAAAEARVLLGMR